VWRYRETSFPSGLFSSLFPSWPVRSFGNVFIWARLTLLPRFPSFRSGQVRRRSSFSSSGVSPLFPSPTGSFTLLFLRQRSQPWATSRTCLSDCEPEERNGCAFWDQPVGHNVLPRGKRSRRR